MGVGPPHNLQPGEIGVSTLGFTPPYKIAFTTAVMITMQYHVYEIKAPQIRKEYCLKLLKLVFQEVVFRFF